MKVTEPQNGHLVPILAPADERVREAFQAHREAVQAAGAAADEWEDARDELNRAPRDAERAGMAAAKAGKPVPKVPDLASLSAKEGHARQRASDLSRATKGTARRLDEALIDALPRHAPALLDVSQDIEAWQQARARYQQETAQALTAAGNARAVAAAMLSEYGGEAGRSVTRDVLPQVGDESDLATFAQPLDVLALLDQRAAPHRAYYGTKPMVDDVGRHAEQAAATLRATLHEQATA